MGSFSTIVGLTPPVLRRQLEYPTVDVSMHYLDMIGKTALATTVDGRVLLLTADTFANLAIEAMAGDDDVYIVGRYVDKNNFYFSRIFTANNTADHEISKFVAGTYIVLVREAVDLAQGHWIKFSLSSATLKSYRDWAATAQISVTDTSFSSGNFGITINRINASTTQQFPHFPAYLRAAGSPSPKPIGYYHVPITGKGTPDDPYRPDLPAVLEVPTSTELDGYPENLRNAIRNNKGGQVNRIAVSWSALIPTDPLTGIPLSKTCIVRVFEQPDRQPHLWKLSEALAKIETTPEIRKLDVTQAKRRALEMDKKLNEKDLEEW